MLLTILRRWSRCCSYSVWLCGLYYGALHVLKSCLALCSRISLFLLFLVITSLWEEGVGLCVSRACVCLFCTCQFLSFFSSSWCRELAAVCGCGTPWTFLLTFSSNGTKWKRKQITTCIINVTKMKKQGNHLFRQLKTWYLALNVANFIVSERNELIYEPPHDKTNNVAVRPAKTQISLGIRTVWSESSLYAQWVAKSPSFLHAHSEHCDQTGRMPRLIWVFAGRTLTLLVLTRGGLIIYVTGY